MTQATMTSKGQITIPKDVRAALGLEAGSKVMFVRLGPRDFRIVARTGKLSDLYGVLARPGRAGLTVDEMNDAVGKAAAESGSAS